VRRFNGKVSSGFSQCKCNQILLVFAGGETSLEVLKFAAAGTTVIDNSSAWRMDPTKN
jgi:aspartate-semialdehyde dehydrogenase